MRGEREAQAEGRQPTGEGYYFQWGWSYCMAMTIITFSINLLRILVGDRVLQDLHTYIQVPGLMT